MKKAQYKKRSDRQNDQVWRLIDSRWVCTSRKHKKWLKNYLNRTIRHKQKNSEDHEYGM